MHSFLIQQHCRVKYKVVSYLIAFSTDLYFLIGVRTESYRIFWEEKGQKLNFAVIPSMIMGTAVYYCHKGKDRNLALKKCIKGEKTKVGGKISKVNIENFTATALDFFEKV